MTNHEALTLALVLGITAPDEATSRAAVLLAEHIARGMDESEVTRCKAAAVRQIEAAA